MLASACKRQQFVAVFPYPVNFFFVSVRSKAEHFGPCLHFLVSIGPQGAGSVCGAGQNIVAAAALFLGSCPAELRGPSSPWSSEVCPCLLGQSPASQPCAVDVQPLLESEIEILANFFCLGDKEPIR